MKLNKKEVEKLLPIKTTAEIANHFGVTKGVVKYFLKKNGLKTRLGVMRANTKPKILKICDNTTCAKETTNPRFCSKSCAAKTTNKENPKRQRKTKCLKCDKITKSYRHTLCEDHFKEYMEGKGLNIRKMALRDFWERPSAKGKHPSWKNAQIRSMARTDFKHLLVLPCSCCGYKAHVQLCHIKPVSEFKETATILEVNSEENLIQLCPNCHWEFDHFEKFDVNMLNENVVKLYNKHKNQN